MEREGLLRHFRLVDVVLECVFCGRGGNSPRGSGDVSRLMAENAGVLVGVPSFSSLIPGAPGAFLYQ